MRLFIVCLALMLTGCVTSTGGKGETVTQKEINAGASMDMETNREAMLAVIAARTDLSTADQVHLVQAIYKKLTLDPTKVRLLETLIKNPAFNSTSKGYVLDGLKSGLVSDLQRRKIMEELNTRGPVPSGDGPTTEPTPVKPPPQDMTNQPM
jgi:hypothetical protein